MSNEDEKRCPLCAEEMDMTDRQFRPCYCGYQVCVWCWHHIMDMAEKDGTEGRCPACRTPYDKKKIVAMEANIECRVVAKNLNRKSKPPKAKPKASEVRKDLTNVRVIQRKMAYVIGLPLSLADENLLQRKEYFGQYGKVYKASLSRTVGGAIQEFIKETCSVYITYSKEEEAIRCIQSVHGFVLEGRLLRASFGTAKYCHAWLKNMPCNNTSCLYLHSIGAEDDSFSKDEEAAVHTRDRVEQVAGGAPNSQWRSGNVLPPPLTEPINICSASADKPIAENAFKDAAHVIVTSSSHWPCLLSPTDMNGGVRAPNKMTTFVDIVGRSCTSAPEKVVNVTDDRRILNLCSEFSSANIDKDHVEAECSDEFQCKDSSSSHLLKSTDALEKADLTPNDASVAKKLPCFMYDSGRQVLSDRCNIVREDLLPFDNQRLKASDISSQMACLFPQHYTARSSEDSGDQSSWHREIYSISDFNMDHSSVHNHLDSIKFTGVNSRLSDEFNEKKFQSSVKSDRIYRGSNSFSNEEIVEHLRRIDDDDKMTNNDQSSAIETVESSIISNILAMDFDACGDSLTMPHCSGGLSDKTDKQHGSCWNFPNNDRSGFCFAGQEGFASQVTDLDYPLSNTGHLSKNYSVLQGSMENKEQYVLNPRYHVTKAQSLNSPVLSLPSREPPPGFSSRGITEKFLHATSGNHSVKTSLPNNHYRTASTGNISSTGGIDFIDPAIMVVDQGKLTNGLNNSGLEKRPNYASQPSSYEDERRLWLLMQQSISGHQDPKFSQIFKQQTPYAHQELRYSGRIGDGFSPLDDIYGLSSRFMDQQQTYNSSFTQFSQQKFPNGYYQLGLDEVQRKSSELGMTELKRNEGLGLNKFYPGYGDLMLQMPRSGDVYTGLFGM